jgi:hypothetical protein
VLDEAEQNGEGEHDEDGEDDVGAVFSHIGLIIHPYYSCVRPVTHLGTSLVGVKSWAELAFL